MATESRIPLILWKLLLTAVASFSFVIGSSARSDAFSSHNHGSHIRYSGSHRYGSHHSYSGYRGRGYPSYGHRYVSRHSLSGYRRHGYPNYGYSYGSRHSYPSYRYGGYGYRGDSRHSTHNAPQGFTIGRKPTYSPTVSARGLIDQSKRTGRGSLQSETAQTYASENVSSRQDTPYSSTPPMVEPYPEEHASAVDTPQPLVDGWTLLVDDPETALAAFAAAATSNPTKGLPKAGYAVAHALLGNDARAIWAMRRALEFEPRALHYAPLDDRLRERFAEMIARYFLRLEIGEGHPGDDRVMIASLAYMRHDQETARRAAEGAIEAGDRLSTTQALLEVIEEQGTP